MVVSGQCPTPPGHREHDMADLHAGLGDPRERPSQPRAWNPQPVLETRSSSSVPLVSRRPSIARIVTMAGLEIPGDLSLTSSNRRRSTRACWPSSWMTTCSLASRVADRAILGPEVQTGSAPLRHPAGHRRTQSRRRAGSRRTATRSSPSRSVPTRSIRCFSDIRQRLAQERPRA